MKHEILFPFHLFPEFFQQAQFFPNIPDFPVCQHGAVGEKFLIMNPSLVPGQEAGEFLQGNIQENADADGSTSGTLLSFRASGIVSNSEMYFSKL